VAGVDQQQLQPALLQHIPAGLPVLPRCLHHHLGNALGLQPVGQRLQARGERRVGADLLAASSPTPPTPAGSGTRMQATTSSLPTSSPAARSTTSSTACHLLPDRLCGWRPAGPTEETMLKRVLAANSSWCREGPCINLRHGLARTNESRAWPGVAILIRRGGQRPWGPQTNFGSSVERNGEASSVMAVLREPGVASGGLVLWRSWGIAIDGRLGVMR
jgi:hypothetical protein